MFNVVMEFTEGEADIRGAEEESETNGDGIVGRHGVIKAMGEGRGEVYCVH